MNNLINKVKLIVRYLASYIPTPLPIGMTEFDAWAKDVLSLTPLPDNDSTRFALASIIPHQKAEHYRVAKIKFVNLLMKSASNQIAGGVMHELKAKQQAAMEAAKRAEAEAAAAAQTAEVTAQDGQASEDKKFLEV